MSFITKCGSKGKNFECGHKMKKGYKSLERNGESLVPYQFNQQPKLPYQDIKQVNCHKCPKNVSFLLHEELCMI